jgi:hypothetical protein
MEDNIIIKEPTAIERYVLCLEEQVAKLTDTLLKTQKDVEDMRCQLNANLAIKPYHDYRLQGCNLTEWFFIRIISLHPLNKEFVIDFLKDQKTREFSMVTSKYMEDRHAIEIIGVFNEYVYLSNLFNRFHDEYQNVNENKFILTVMSVDKVSDYMCIRFDLHKKQLVMERLPAPLMYKLNEENNVIECVEMIPFGRPEPYFMKTRTDTPIMEYVGMI